jgi:Uma2 family endonuclease
LSYEIIDGELIVSRKPHLRHAAIIGKLYARTGAQEYWIIDWQRQLVEVWTFTKLAARVVTYILEQTITTPLIPGVSISVEELLD